MHSGVDSSAARLVIIRGESHLRNTTEGEILVSLSQSETAASRKILDLNTLHFRDPIDSGYWDSLAAHLQGFASRLLEELNGPDPVKLCYFGVEEIPTLIALGAYLGDEHPIDCRDYDRVKNVFSWPSDVGSVSFETTGLPVEKVDVPGDAVIRVELSYPVKNSDVDDVVAQSGRLADISIRPANQNPTIELLRSQADVESFRMAFREALAAIDSARPNTQLVHLFISGPVSACVVAGQELRLRNGRRVQTYRYRAKNQPSMNAAILLTPEAATVLESPLSDDDRLVAAQARSEWGQALKELIQHADMLRDAAKGADDAWPKYLLPSLRTHYDGTVHLPKIWEVVTADDAIGAEHSGVFYFNATNRTWHFDDRMMVIMSRATAGNSEKMRRLARAFFWHEYAHTFQNLTHHTAAGVGGFPNCLERIDYVADLYGVLHQADYVLRNQSAPTEKDVIAVLAQCITEAIDSFWTFEPVPPTRWWQQRRLRRYLNWYWRREQIRRAATLKQAMSLLSEPPVIEVSGLPIATDRRRILLDFSKIDRCDQLEVGLVSESNKLVRCPNSVTLSVVEMLKAFADQDCDKIDEFFAALYDHATR